MKIRRLNEDAKRFYVDEIVSAPGGKTETERHSFATIDELKQYCKDAGLTKDDIANCGGCELKDILTEDVKKLHAQSKDLEFLANEFNTALAEEGFEYTIDIVDGYKIYVESDNLDVIDTFAAEFFKKHDLIPDIETCGSGHCYMLKRASAKVKEEVEKLHTKPNGEYLVKSDSGKGYTAFNRDNVAIGGIDNEDAGSDDKAIDKFKKNEYSECLNEAYFDTAEYRIQKYEDDIPELMAGMHDDYMEGKLDAAHYAEVLKKVYDALAECDYKHTMSEPVVTNGTGKRVLDALAELDKTNESVKNEALNEAVSKSTLAGIFRTLGDAYGKIMLDSEQADKILAACEKEPTGKDATFDEILAVAQDVIANTPLAAAALVGLAEAVFDALMVLATAGLIVIPIDGNVGECITGLLAAIPVAPIVAAVVALPAAGATRLIQLVRKSLRKDDVEKVEKAAAEAGVLVEKKINETVEYDEDNPDTWPWKERVEYEQDKDWVDSYFLDDMFSDVADKAFAIVEAEGYTDVFTEPSTQMGQGADFYWATKDGVRYTGRHDFQDQESGFWSCCEKANSREEAIELMAKYYASNILSALIPEDEEDYDDDYSNEYDDSLEECSGVKAHKVIMGEDIDDSVEFDDADGVEGPEGDKTEDIEFVMDEYVSESLLIDFIEKVDPVTYKVGANDQVVTVVFDPKWSEYVYTIDGKGPYSHSSYEFISRDIYDFVMSQTDDSELDDVVD